MAAGSILGCSTLMALSLLLRVVYFGQNTTKLSANCLCSPMKVFYYKYDGNPDVFALEKFDYAVCDVRHFGSCFHRPNCSQSCRGKFGKSILNYYSNSDASFSVNYLKVCGDVHPNPGPSTANNNPKQNTDSTKSRKAPVWKYPCALCSKPVRANQKGILCDICNRWLHIKCLNMDPKLYMALSSSDEGWCCNDCTSPFKFTDSFFEASCGSDGFDVSSNEENQTSTANSRNSFPKCLVLNARSLRNKIFDLQALLLVDVFDVVAVTETWLDSNFGDHELLMDDFNIFRKDRHIQRGGGVLLAVRNHLPCTRRFDLEVEAEMLALEICLTHKIRVVVAVFYRSPNSDADTFLFQLRQFLDKYSRTGLLNLIVTGDFNFPNIDWYTGSSFRSDPSADEFCNILGDFFLIQKNMFATRGLCNTKGNILDLVLTNNEFLVRDVSVHPNAFDSDHFPLTFTLVAETNRPQNVQRKVYCYKKADFIGLREILHHIPWESVISDCPFEDCLTRFQDILFSAINQCIPQVTLRRRSRPPWISNEIMKLIRKKKKLWKRMKASGSSNLFLKFKEMRKITKKHIHLSYIQYLKDLSVKLKTDPKLFWSFHSMKSKRKRIPEIVYYNETHSTNPTTKVELFNQFFRSVYSAPISEKTFPIDDVVNPNLLSSIKTTSSEVKRILQNLDVNKATGADNIPARILKVCSEELSKPLALLYNRSFSVGRVPVQWKLANISPVHKANERDRVDNYRSISLLSIPGKCQERIVYSAIYSHVSAYLSDWQHGFVKGRSTATQLILTHHKWAKALDEGHQVDVVFLDFSKAFDRVSHQALLHKLCNFGISGELLNWCQDYLSNRRQRVVIDGYSSSLTEITSGVPQGSILGPLFFVLFINDLAEVVCSTSTIALYADDSKMFRIINCDDDQTIFQNDLDKLYQWSLCNLMNFNSKKCKIMRITKKQVPFTSKVNLNDTVLDEVKEFKDLGILTDNNLSWNSHIDMITAKANRMLGLIKRTCRDLKDESTLKTLYCSLVRSNLEYCSVVWCPFTKRNVNKIERIQRRATRFILKSNEPYDVRLSRLNLLTLAKRRFVADVTFLFNALNGNLDVNFSQFLDFYSQEDRYLLRHFDIKSLKKKYARTNILKNSFFYRIVDEWNSLPFDVRSASNVHKFKAAVTKFVTKL